MTATPTRTASSGAQPRCWRNNNPGNLRSLGGRLRWAGQAGVDEEPGGPFVIFDSRQSGWRGVATNLLAYEEVHELRTVNGIIDRWAPPSDHNDTSAYKAAVCHAIGRGRDESIAVNDQPTLVALMKAIAAVEGGPHVDWPEAEIVAGAAEAGVIGPAAAPTVSVEHAAAAAPSASAETADDYNEAELDQLASPPGGGTRQEGTR